MKLEDLPDFAKPFKVKGYDVRCVHRKYQLFKIRSERVEGKKYPVLRQEYIGTIDPVKGLIEKRTADGSPPTMVEFGLSFFILKHFRRRLVKSMFNGGPERLLLMGVTHFMYGHAEERFIRLSYIFRDYQRAPQINLAKAGDRIERLSLRISQYLEELLPDKSDRDFLVVILRDFKVNIDNTNPVLTYSDEAKAILDKYQVKYE